MMTMHLFRRTVSLVLAAVLAASLPLSGAIAGVVPPAGEDADHFELLDVVGSVGKGSCISDGRLVTVGSAGLAIWDITEPSAPVRLGMCVFGGGRQVVATPTHAFVVTIGGALASFDITDPTAPVLVTTLPGAVSSPKSTDAIAMAGNTVYLSGNSRIYPVDVSDPSSMIAGTAFLSGQSGGSWCLDVDGTRLAAANNANIAYFDVSAPSVPATLSLTPFAALDAGGIDLVGDTLFLGSYNETGYGFAAFDMSSGTAALTDFFTNGTWFGSVAVDASGTAHVVNDGIVMTLFDVTDPADISTVGETGPAIDGTPNPSDVTIDPSGTAAYWCDARYGLFAFDVTVPTAPSIGASLRTPDYAQDVAVLGDALYVADSTRGILTYDITDPSAPVFTSEIRLSSVYGLRVHGGLLLANRSPGVGQFTVLDLADPTNPVVADTIAVPASSYGNDVAAVGDRAYVLAAGGVRVIDISDPYDLTEVGSWTGSFDYSAIDATGTIAVVGATSGSMQALDISADTPVTLGGSLGAWDIVNDVVIADDACYFATEGSSGGYGLLQVSFSTSGLGAIEYRAFPANTETVRGLALTPEGRLIAAAHSGVYVWDVPMNQEQQPPVAVYSPVPYGMAVALDGPNAFVAAQYNGVYALEGPDFTGPTVSIGGVDEGAAYGSPVTPFVTFGADATHALIELDGVAWTPGQVSDPGAHILRASAQDEWGNATERTVSFRVLTGSEARISGTDRFATSAQISARTFKSADAVVIATGRNYPDALAAAPLAYELNGPILLVDSTSVPASILAEIARLGASEAYIIGGTSAVSPAVETALKGAGLSTERISGASRYATARKIAQRLRELTGAPLPKAYIATGEKFPDALAAGGLAAYEGAPILLVRASGVPQDTTDAIEECGVTSTVVLGGTAAIPDSVAGALPAHTRISGVDRFETCRRIAEVSLDAGFDDEAVFLSTGANFPDALSAGVASAAYRAPVLLVKDPLPAAAATYATDHADSLWNIMPVGGTLVVPSAVLSAFRNLLL